MDENFTNFISSILTNLVLILHCQVTWQWYEPSIFYVFMLCLNEIEYQVCFAKVFVAEIRYGAGTRDGTEIKKTDNLL